MQSRLPEPYFSTRFIVDSSRALPDDAFAIVTAFNPMDEACSDATNTAADAALLSDLEQAGTPPFRVTGGSPDGTHQEPGWGFVAPLSKAVILGKKFNQRALWWIENDTLYLVDCENPSPFEISKFSERVQNP